MTMLEINVKVYEGKTKEGKKFNYYKAVQKGGSLIDLRFRKDVTPPLENSIIFVKHEDINKDDNRVYPCLWVKKIQHIKPIEFKKVDKKVLEMFDTVEAKDNELPF